MCVRGWCFALVAEEDGELAAQFLVVVEEGLLAVFERWVGGSLCGRDDPGCGGLALASQPFDFRSEPGVAVER